MRITRTVIRQAERVERVSRQHTTGAIPPLPAERTTVGLVQRVLTQTRARVFREGCHGSPSARKSFANIARPARTDSHRNGQ
jgi:hypothetical protein